MEPRNDECGLSQRERAFLEYRIEVLEEKLRRELDLREQARNLQAVEYERRLTVLNHAHENAIREQARVLPRELFDVHRRDYEEFKLSVSNQLASATARSITWTVAIGLFFTIISIAIRFVK